jgi:SAM-dependent methyltransferase
VSERQLLEEQYANPSNLRARISLHARFSTNPGSYPRWVFDGYDFGERAVVLEVGCGDGVIWRENTDRIPEGWMLTLTDLSRGMVDAARTLLGDRASYAVADVSALPFADESFDGVIANHMLFHVEDRATALREIRRVLRPAGKFNATTIGRDHLKELHTLAPPREGGQWALTRGRFTIETAAEELAPFFADVVVERYPDSLEVTDADALADFVGSRGDEPEERIEAVRAHASAVIAREGAFHVTKDTARIRARKP